jgi:hypothetical protein
MNEKLEKLLQQEQQLRARIQKEKARLSQKDRQRRTGKLIAWGVVIEEMLSDPEESLTPEQWANTCNRFLNGRTLDRALADELDSFKKDREEMPP